MNFSSAFKYPFQNFAKVMSIVLAFDDCLRAFHRHDLEFL